LTLNGVTPIGTQYEAGWFLNRERGTFTTPRDAQGNPLGTESVYTADLTMTLTQPLLRGVGTNANLVFVRTAQNQQLIAQEQMQLQLLLSIGDVVKAYWDLVGAIEQVTVQQQALEIANRVLRINEQRYELGTAAALEVLSAKAGVAQRQSDLISARTAVFAAEDILKTLIGMYDESGELLSMNSLIPIERPHIQDPEWDMETSMRTALDRRPDIKIAELQVKNSELEVKRARNDLLPQFDLQGSYGRNALRLDGSETFDGLAEPDGRSFTIGGIFSIPLGNRTARGNFAQSKLITRQLEQRQIKAEQDVMLNVRLAIQGLASNRILVESTKQSRVLEEANVAAEERRLRIGVTTAQIVLDRQEDLTAAQALEVNAQVSFEKSLIDLQVAEGTLLENMGIVYEVPDYDETLGYFESFGPVNVD
jgi:outer membrane protein TolC